MPIINGNLLKKEKLKVDIHPEVAQKIEAYCKWANITDLGFFIEEAACFVFAKDKDWKQYQRSLKKQAHKKTPAST